MKNKLSLFITIILFSSCNVRQEKFKTKLSSVTPLEEDHLGVSAAFCGIHNDYIVIAGGCNFPDISAAEGGKKKYYNDVYVIHKDSVSISKWRKTGALSYPVAYGASVSTKAGILCIGGMNNNERLSKTFLLGYDTLSNSLIISDSPLLPFTIDNAAAVLCGNKVYVGGGNKNSMPSNLLLSCDIQTDNEWIVEDTIPEYPRVQPILLSRKTRGHYDVIIQSGFYHSSDTTIVHTDGYLYTPENKKWHQLSSPSIDGNKISLTGGIGFVLNDSLSICFGGVNKNIFQYGLTISEQYATAKKKKTMNTDSLQTLVNAYMKADVNYYKFNQNHWLYNSNKDEWLIVGSSAATALAGASGVAVDKNHIILINGELKPGIRTNTINLITTNPK